ncbi:hypothetical protein HPB48_010973 [Haemaphysalis longicornis]|uniref:ABC transporter domain-containing protein n=1 Tax=Haemaphysalis longicornis TaxID=44386 RepID=A0A9J6GMU3_HAELO|nr:hypothetical protein HPB48_010973 [Haemaphysalis longicornis]
MEAHHACWLPSARKDEVTAQYSSLTVVLGRTTKSWRPVELLSTSEYGILPDVLIMFVEGLLIFVYLLFRLSAGFLPSMQPPRRKITQQKIEQDVAAERSLVLNLCAASTFSQHSMVANNLRKNFGDLQAVRGIYLALRPGECFGLLGVNGAGKTTTFRILAALISMNEGEAYMPDLVLSRNARTSRLGYCPQEDALLEKLNAFETLFMFGRLRGVPEKRLGAAVDLIIDIVDLREHAHKTCRYYR